MSCRKRSCEEDNSDTIYKKKPCVAIIQFIPNAPTELNKNIFICLFQLINDFFG